MTFIIVLIAAIICTVAWKRKSSRPEMKIGILSLIYWIAFFGCSADKAFGFIKYKEIPFSFSVGAIIHDSYTGIGILAVGLVIWLGLVILINRVKNK